MQMSSNKYTTKGDRVDTNDNNNRIMCRRDLKNPDNTFLEIQFC